MMEVQKWENSLIEEKLKRYKRISAGAIPYMAIFAGLTSLFNFDFIRVKQRSIYDLDLKICGKLSNRLILK